MDRHSLVTRAWGLAAIWLACVADRPAAADPPDILREFYFIPSRSIVHVTGGFAGVNWKLETAGRFSVVTGYDYEATPPDNVPTIVRYARFEEVDAILYDPRSAAPTPTPGWDLDETLNLTGLDGTFSPGDPIHLDFSGVDGQGMPIKLEGTMTDSLIHLVGANDPASAGGADFFNYDIDLLASTSPNTAPGDADLDDDVDLADLGRLASSFGMNGADIDWGNGDFDLDNDVDVNDLGTLATFFGGGSAGAYAEFQAFVPEPAAGTLILALAPAVLRGWRQQLDSQTARWRRADLLRD